MSQFSDHSSTLWSGPGSICSEASLATSVSAFPQPPTNVSRSMWYTDTPTVKNSLKALLHSTCNSSTEALQYSGGSSSHTPVKGTIHASGNIPSVHPLLSRPSTSSSSELSRQSTTSSIPQQSPFGLDNKESLPPNVSKSIFNTPNGFEAHRRPLPKPPRESALRRTQSSSPSTTTSTRTFRSLPPTPLLEVSEPEDSLVLGTHSGSPPMKKVTQDLTGWVHELTDPQRVLSPSTPSPTAVVFDLPPPSYSSIYAPGDKPNVITTTTATTTAAAPST
jgi:hypothetical protein